MAANHAINSETRRRAKIPSSLGAFEHVGSGLGPAHPVGQVGNNMVTHGLTVWGAKRAMQEFGELDRSRGKPGELPPAPPRPQGLERNVVITQWDWSGPKEYFQ